MSDSLHKRARTVAALGIAAALAVGGVALAQGGSGGKSHHRTAPGARRMPPPPGAPAGKDLTYAQLHVQRNGQAKVVRLDRGKIVAVDDTSITLSENDGNEVTIPIDDGTRVLAGPGHKTEVGDLEVGQQVTVCGPEGGTAKAIMLPPKRWQMPGGPQGSSGRGELPPPPPGGQLGPAQGGSN
jgi:hypothetical protein